MTFSPNKTLETNHRLVTPLDAQWMLKRALFAQLFVRHLGARVYE